MQRFQAGLGALLLAMAPAVPPLQADVLLLDGIEANLEALPERPARGMSMTAVEQRFGDPELRLAAVGEPPIARWEYDEFIVYFEHDRVIHAALRRATN